MEQIKPERNALYGKEPARRQYANCMIAAGWKVEIHTNVQVALVNILSFPKNFFIPGRSKGITY